MIAGVDEVGRGPLVGPVVAAAVVLNPNRWIEGLADSKALTAARRESLAEQIYRDAEAVNVVFVSAQEIDQVNILQATYLAMSRAVEGLSCTPSHVLVDGNRIPPQLSIPATAVVKGDAKKASISAASIVAKVARDQWCFEYHRVHPDYGFDQHKGYPTALHLDRLHQLGPTDEHRRSFKPVAQLRIL